VAGVIIALDAASAAEARGMVERLGDRADFYKVGLELYTRAGPDFVHELTGLGKRVFLDLKLHDIPNTVAGAVRAAHDLGVELLTVHASGGERMLEAAVGAAEDAAPAGPGSPPRLRLLAVTVLTSLTAEELGGAWGRAAPEVSDEVRRLALLAERAGVHGVVASPLEAALLRTALAADLLIVTPGIRPTGAASGDQKRIATPADAVVAGSDYLVVGRAVTAAPDPVEALAAVLREVEGSAPRPARADRS